MSSSDRNKITHSAGIVGEQSKIAVVIPSFNVKQHILSVIEGIGPEVTSIYVVDDCCPEKTGEFVEQNCQDSRVTVVFNNRNKGVGGATIAGYRKAILDQAEIVIKLDGDGQMDPALIPQFIAPIVDGRADYIKGNRFYKLETLAEMPSIRIFGNAVLSFVTKATSGYWDLMDPTNGFTAIHSEVLKLLPLDKIENRYFFENDMLFRLNTIRAVVREIPMESVYRDEKSNMNIAQIALDFPLKYSTRFIKRIFYCYFLRDFNVCSIELISGLLLVFGGSAFGILKWYQGVMSGSFTSAGTVMLAVLPIILGFQLLLAAVSFDVANIPRNPLGRMLGCRAKSAKSL